MAAFALMLVSCAKDAESVDSTPIEKGNSNVVAQQPVSFGAYVNRATTRAGAAGELTNDGANGKVSLQDEGFGVFAYFTDDKPYTPDYNPNFMYNTQVTYDASANAWTYSPMRYWPNENSANDASEGIDRLSFFAYAPHVSVNQITGFVANNPESGIVAMNRNGAIGDPMIYYRVDYDPANQVDFCWGTPHVDMTKPAVGQPVEFEFNHAVAARNVQIDAIIDEVSPGNNNIEDETKIYVRSVTFEGFAEQGAFNLNTTTDTFIWYDITGTDYIEGDKVVIHDGRINGNEGSSEAINELPKGLNRVIVQSARYGDSDLLSGVTKDAVNLFDNTAIDAPIYVIPTGQPLKLTIVYDVETQVDKLPGYLSDGVTHGSSIENKITKTITLNAGENLRLEAGKKYTVKLHLGMSSLKFDASISDWDAGSSADADLPINSSTTPDPTPTPGPGSAPEGTSGGLFSVSATKQVYIATSNLMWEGTTAGGNYSFMEKPWTTIETNGTAMSMPANYGISDTNSVQVSLFGWGTPDTPYLTSDDEDDYATNGFVDWGTQYGDGKWRCLTGDEWRYVLTRNVSGFGKGFGFATVNNVHGIILIPDNFETPSGLTFTAGLGNQFDTNQFTESEWETMQSAGAVFLPAAGYRDADSEHVLEVGDMIDYWSSTELASLYYEEDYGFNIEDEYNYKTYGCSVRLVYDKE